MKELGPYADCNEEKAWKTLTGMLETKAVRLLLESVANFKARTPFMTYEQ